MSFEKEVSSATGSCGRRSLTFRANAKTSGSPTLYIVSTKSKPSSSASVASASAVELTRVSEGGLERFRSRYSRLICDSMRPSSSRMYPS